MDAAKGAARGQRYYWIMNANVQASYDQQRDHEGRQTALPSAFTRPTGNDAWRHRRMLECALPLLREYPGSSWMTIGDGNFGSDAYFLKNNGAKVLATSISDATLRVAKEKGFVEDIKAENAETLSCGEDAFDFTFCKEAYHHFPRPAIAFYEMLRASRKAVVLIEPCEAPVRPLDFAKALVKKLLRRDLSALFESSGNFIFRLNVREVEKMMTALNYRCVAYRAFNDFYHPRLSRGEFRPWSARTMLLRLGILAQDALCALRLMNPGLSCVAAFKREPSPELTEKLVRAGFRMSRLPMNPYAA